MPGFHVTLWPDPLPPVPKVRRYPARVDEKKRKLVLDTTGGSRRREPPEELYLRELHELNLESDQAVADFSSEHGGLWGWGGLVEDTPPRTQPKQSYMDLAQRSVGWGGVVDLDWIVLRAQILKAMVACWRFRQGGLSLAELQGDWTVNDPHYLAPTSADEALGFLVLALNAGLRPFSVHAVLGVKGEDRPDFWPYDEPTLYHALCLQLARDMALDLPYRTCANEPCHRLFLRQRGGSLYGQHRVHDAGLLYCSPLCARAQGERNRRKQRKLLEQDAGTSGGGARR